MRDPLGGAFPFPTHDCPSSCFFCVSYTRLSPTTSTCLCSPGCLSIQVSGHTFRQTGATARPYVSLKGVVSTTRDEGVFTVCVFFSVLRHSLCFPRYLHLYGVRMEGPNDFLVWSVTGSRLRVPDGPRGRHSGSSGGPVGGTYTHTFIRCGQRRERVQKRVSTVGGWCIVLVVCLTRIRSPGTVVRSPSR